MRKTGRDFLPAEMVRTGVFYRMWLAYAFGTTAGLMVIGRLAAFAQGAGFSARDASISVVVLSVGNGCGIAVDAITVAIERQRASRP